MSTKVIVQSFFPAVKPNYICDNSNTVKPQNDSIDPKTTSNTTATTDAVPASISNIISSSTDNTFNNGSTNDSSNNDSNEMGVKKEAQSIGRWTAQEHKIFLRGLDLFGKNWKKISDMVVTRTVVQTRTHAQKYFQKLNGGKAKNVAVNNEDSDSNADNTDSGSTSSSEISSTKVGNGKTQKDKKKVSSDSGSGDNKSDNKNFLHDMKCRKQRKKSSTSTTNETIKKYGHNQKKYNRTNSTTSSSTDGETSSTDTPLLEMEDISIMNLLETIDWCNDGKAKNRKGKKDNTKNKKYFDQSQVYNGNLTNDFHLVEINDFEDHECSKFNDMIGTIDMNLSEDVNHESKVMMFFESFVEDGQGTTNFIFNKDLKVANVAKDIDIKDESQFINEEPHKVTEAHDDLFYLDLDEVDSFVDNTNHGVPIITPSGSLCSADMQAFHSNDSENLSESDHISESTDDPVKKNPEEYKQKKMKSSHIIISPLTSPKKRSAPKSDYSVQKKKSCNYI